MIIKNDISYINPNLIQMEDEFNQTLHDTENFIKQYHDKDLDELFFKGLYKLNIQSRYLLSSISLLNGVTKTEEYTLLYEKLSKLYSNYQINFFSDKNLYSKYLAVQSKPFVLEFKELKFLVDKTIQEFENNGIQLSSTEQLKYKTLSDKLIELKNKYNSNLIQSKKYLLISLNKDDTEDLSEDLREQLNKFLDKEQKFFNIPFSSGLFSNILKNSNSESVRKTIYHALKSIGLDKYDNRPVLQEIVNLRQKIARLLGHKTAAHHAMLDNMVTQPEKVFEFLNNLTEKFTPYYLEESNMLNNWGNNLLGRPMALHDRAFIINNVLKNKYNVDGNKIKEYFPVNYVINKTFAMFGELFDIKLEKINNKNIWHEDVLTYQVLDKDNHQLGTLYLDLFLRDNKRGGACCGSLNEIDEYCFDEKILTNTYIICNFSKNINLNEETYLTHDDVVTFYHEFGHALHHFLSKNKISFINGTNMVQGDAVELPSQFLEHFCYDKNFLKAISNHKTTHESLSDLDIEKLNNSRSFLEPTSIVVRHALSSYIDMYIYSEPTCIASDVEIKAIKKFVKHTEQYEDLRELHELFHIFTSGYNAGLYFYKWADIMAYDTYKGVIESGTTLEEIKPYMLQFKNKIYAPGGYSNFMSHYIDFRGREPSIDSMIDILKLGTTNQNKLKI